MEISFDSATMAGLVAALIALCYGLQFWDGDQSNFLDKICKGLFYEIINDNRQLIDSVKATGVNLNSTGIGQRLHRTFRCCADEYHTSNFVYFISGMAIISTVLCLFLIALPFFGNSTYRSNGVFVIRSLHSAAARRTRCDREQHRRDNYRTYQFYKVFHNFLLMIHLTVMSCELTV